MSRVSVISRWDGDRSIPSRQSRLLIARSDTPVGLVPVIRVSRTPTFFINGRRLHGAYVIDHPVARSPRRRRPRQAGGVLALRALPACGPSSRSASAGLAVDLM